MKSELMRERAVLVTGNRPSIDDGRAKGLLEFFGVPHETRRAADLAQNPWQLAMARKQLQEIRKLRHESVRNVEWTKPLTAPTLALAAMFALLFVVMMWH